MQIAPIAISLKNLAASDPMASALAEAGLVGGIHYGVRASRLNVDRPFATFSINEIERNKNSSGVALVVLELIVTVYVDLLGETAAAIMDVFQTYWSRITELESLDPDIAELVLIYPESAEIEEADDEDLGRDVIVGIASWTLQISESEPELEE